MGMVFDAKIQTEFKFKPNFIKTLKTHTIPHPTGLMKGSS
jgi:hypothetical protein